MKPVIILSTIREETYKKSRVMIHYRVWTDMVDAVYAPVSSLSVRIRVSVDNQVNE